jgi:nicotinate-nucleotide adenylyltransferase
MRRLSRSVPKVSAAVNSSNNILIFGGTFDPPHLAHTVLPPLVAERIGCRKIVYIPAALNPLKADTPPTANHHRLAMLRAATETVPNAVIDTIELDREGPSYMVDTLQKLRTRYGKSVQLRLLIGADQALDFHRWRDWQKIIDLAPPVVMLRPPWKYEAYLAELNQRYSSDEVQQWIDWTIPLPMIDISSTEIRKRIERGENLTEILAPAVVQYIQAHRLYSDQC